MKEKKAQAALEYLLIIGGSILMVALILYLITGFGETGITGEKEASFKYSNVLSGLEERASGKDTTPPEFGVISFIGGEGAPRGNPPTVKGIIGITVPATDESGIEKVEFFLVLRGTLQKETKIGGDEQTNAYFEAASSTEIKIGEDTEADASGNYYITWDTTKKPPEALFSNSE